MAMPVNLDMQRIKKDLKEKGKQLSINEINDCLAVSCFLHDLCYDFSLVVEDEEEIADPYAPIREEQLTELHRLFRRELKKEPYCFTEKDFSQLYKHMQYISAMLLSSCIERATKVGNKGKDK